MLQESCLYVSFNLNYIFRFHNANCNVSPTFCMSRLIINSNGLRFLQLLMLSFYLYRCDGLLSLHILMLFLYLYSCYGLFLIHLLMLSFNLHRSDELLYLHLLMLFSTCIAVYAVHT